MSKIGYLGGNILNDSHVLGELYLDKEDESLWFVFREKWFLDSNGLGEDENFKTLALIYPKGQRPQLLHPQNKKE